MHSVITIKIKGYARFLPPQTPESHCFVVIPVH